MIENLGILKWLAMVVYNLVASRSGDALYITIYRSVCKVGRAELRLPLILYLPIKIPTTGIYLRQEGFRSARPKSEAH